MRNSFPAEDVVWAACEAGGCRRGSGSCSCCCSGNEPQPGQLVRVLVGRAASHADDVRRVATAAVAFTGLPGHQTQKLWKRLAWSALLG